MNSIENSMGGRDQVVSKNGIYDDDYFRWQKELGDFGGWADLSKFEQYVSPSFNVIDFGCGGGYLLNNLRCAGKKGIEINESAQLQAREFNIDVFTSTNEIENDWADLIISNHALEHTLNPLQELKDLYTKLKPDGRVIFVVPCQSIHEKYNSEDKNHHLFTWNPLTLGNLFTTAGFSVDESSAVINRWPPYYRKIAYIGGRRVFEICCQIYGHLQNKIYEVKLVAHKQIR
jgi:SAM-dependent methyltransferase